MLLKKLSTLTLAVTLYSSCAYSMQNEDVQSPDRIMRVERIQNAAHEQHILNVLQQPDPGTVCGAIHKGALNGVQGSVQELTQTVMSNAIISGFMWAKEKVSPDQEAFEKETLNSLVNIKNKIDVLMTLKSMASDAEDIAKFEVCIKEQRSEMQRILKQHLAMTTKKRAVIGG